MLPATNPTQSRHPALWGGLLAAWSADMPGAGNRIVEPANQLHAIWAGQDQHPIVAGPGRRGFRFDGVNDTANAGNRLATSQRSIALWVMLSATAADAGLLTKASDSAFVSGTNTWGLFFDTNVVNTSLTNRFCFIERRINGVASNWAQVCSATQPVIGRWYHVVVVRGAGRTELYIDGARDVAYAQNTTSAPGSETAYNHHLGSFNGAGGWLSGRLAEVLLYARALSPAEVRMLASGASPLERRRPNVTLRTASGVTLSPTGIASGEAVGTPTVQPGAVTITATGIASGEAFGTPTLTTTVTVSPAGIASSEAFGAPAILTGTVLVPAGIASGEAFGAPTVTRGAVTLLPAGIATAAACGTPVVWRNLQTFPCNFAGPRVQTASNLTVV